MVILNPVYLPTGEIYANVDGQEMTVPIETANRHYAEIMRQVEAGTLTILPPDEPEETP